MRNAVIVAAANCVVFLLALISGNSYLAGAVIVLSVIGLLLVVRDVQGHRERQTATPPERALTPDEFTPDILEADADDEAQHAGPT